MPYVPFLSQIHIYLNYQRPLGYIDVYASSLATGLKPAELLERFLQRNLFVYLDFEPYRGQGALRELLLKKQTNADLMESVGNLQGTLFIKDISKNYSIKPGIYPLTEMGLQNLIHRYKADYEGEELLTGLQLMTPDEEPLRKEFGDSGERIFVRLENALFIGHPWFHPRDVLKLEDLEKAMSPFSSSELSEVETNWNCRPGTQIFNPQTYPYDYISTNGFVEPDREQRLKSLCKEFSIQLEKIREVQFEESTKLDDVESNARTNGPHRQSPPTKNNHLVSPVSRKPHSAFIEQQIKEGSRDWRVSWALYLKLADGEWREVFGHNCKLTLLNRTVGRETIRIEFDCQKEDTLKRDAFRMVFARYLKKSEH